MFALESNSVNLTNYRITNIKGKKQNPHRIYLYVKILLIGQWYELLENPFLIRPLEISTFMMNNAINFAATRKKEIRSTRLKYRRIYKAIKEDCHQIKTPNIKYTIL